ncbi:peptidyl-prolyl cis-trans isomerase [Pseudomonas sp. RIT-PI-AD]|uniref:peptidyl-prolyl cis-trans isomerase n=1 Tax=Pseudomonas sp. RIT-PI-AD TaxID=3035294 RepID=UPI0021DA3AEE|nr:peptidyl-prolyl cis-trans isomerase [Pseudomonas sp. RIT-PI-AD]
MRKAACRPRRTLAGLAFVTWLAGALPALAGPDLSIDGERLPAASVDLVQQALARLHPGGDPLRVRRGLVENRLLARQEEAGLPERQRRALDAQVDDEAERLVELVYGERLEADLQAFRLPDDGLDAARLRALLAPRGNGLRLDSQALDAGQRAAAAATRVRVWRFAGGAPEVLDLLDLYEAEEVQGRAELQEGNLDYLEQRADRRLRRAYRWQRLAEQGFGAAERDGLRRIVRDKLVRQAYLRQVGLTDELHQTSAYLQAAARQVGDAEARAYYQRHGERYRNVARVRAAHLRLADQASADRVYAELQAGLAFDEAVRRHSQAADKALDPPGDLGIIHTADPRLDLLHKAALIQKADTLSRPMLIDGAFEIIRVGEREDRQLPLEDPAVRAEVDQAVARERIAAQLQARLDEQMARARVDGL